MANFGYAGKILWLDLSSGNIAEASTLDYGSFLGGRGIAAKIHWDEVSPDVGALDPGNELVFVTGPLAGVPGLNGGSRWQVCGKSPAPSPEQFSYGNLGGRWGACLKFAGYDAVVVRGKSDKPACLYLHEDGAVLRDASNLWGKGTIETKETLKSEFGSSASVVTIGPAGESMAVMATVVADNDACGSGGLGAVMGSKGLKAIVVQSADRGMKVAQPERLKDLETYRRGLRRIRSSMSGVRYSRDKVPSLSHKMKRREPCYGCTGCFRVIYEAEDGAAGKYMCHSAMYYQPWAVRYYGTWDDMPSDLPFHATRLVDDYGLDTKVMERMIGWLASCYKAGVLTDEKAGIPVSKVGTMEFLESLFGKISRREGLGDILAQGVAKAAQSLGPDALGQIDGAGYLGSPPYTDTYGPRLYPITALAYAMGPRLPYTQLHEVGALIPKWLLWAGGAEGALASSDVVRAIARRFWGSEMAIDFSTYEGKALAAKKIEDRETAKECLVMCDFQSPIMDLESTDDHVGDPTLDSKILSAVTGNEVDDKGLNEIGERVFNLMRAISVREGRRGRDSDQVPDHCYTVPLHYEMSNPDCLVPGKDGEPFPRKGAVVDREAFEKMKDEYYELRQWDVATGLQTLTKLRDLGLEDVARDLEQRGLAV
ncbi:aldehyde ferredoxin oxidoreductase N-terminal domain-containing protein [Chloroflexota bacterium]